MLSTVGPRFTTVRFATIHNNDGSETERPKISNYTKFKKAQL